jgi:hypothetical protein
MIAIAGLTSSRAMQFQRLAPSAARGVKHRQCFLLHPASRRAPGARVTENDADAFPVCIKQISKGRIRPTTLRGVRLSFVVYAVAYGDLLGFALIYSRFEAQRYSY